MSEQCDLGGNARGAFAMSGHFTDSGIERLRSLMALLELNFRLLIEGGCLYPAIQPRHLIGSLEERLLRGWTPPAEAASDIQQDAQQQTGSNAWGGGRNNSHATQLRTRSCCQNLN